ncbi:hypothetical protein JCM10450v2_004897 [Rhodotorula kratochvilovae]
MSSQGLVQARADLSSLPEELLKHIVELVDDQDRKISKLNITFEGTGGQYSHESRWPVQYKHGLHALALTSRRMRALALPFLFATVTPKQLAQPFFRLGRLPTVAVDAIVCLDMQTCTESALLDVAVALPSLTNLREIKVNTATARLLTSTNNSRHGVLRDNRLIIKAAFGSTASRVEALVVERLTGTTPLATILECFTTPDALRELRLSSPTLTMETTGLADVLPLYSCIQRLDLGDLSDIFYEDLIDEPPWMELNLHALRHIAPSTANSDVIAFIHSVAPNITSVELRLSESMKSRYDYGGAIVALPALRHLSLNGPPASIHIISLLDAPQLTSLDLEARIAPDEAFDGAAFLRHDILPSSLRSLRISRRLGSHFTNLALLRDWCTEHGTHLVLDNVTPFTQFDARSSASVSVAPREGQKLALQRTLAWATARVELLWRWGDGKGMDELTCALRRMREREVIEEM